MKSLLICGFVAGLVVPAFAQYGNESGGVLPPMAVVTSPVAIPIAPVAPMKAPYAPTGLDEIIRAKYPLAVRYDELGVGWREITWDDGIYFSKGETHRIKDREYLITYKFESQFTSQLSEKEYVAAATGNVRAYAPDDRFVITLLDMESLIPYFTSGNTNLHSFDLARRRVVFDAAKTTDAFNQSLSLIYLRKIYDAVQSYSASYLQTLPPMPTAFAARQALLPFAENAGIFTIPGTNQPFKANPLFSGRKRAHLYKRSRAVLFYEGNAASDGSRGVLLLNGITRRLDAKAWRELKSISGLD